MNAPDLNSWEVQVRKGLIEFMTLHLVSIKETHGYEIVQRMRELPGFNVTESAIYPILSRFREDGVLTVHSLPSPTGPRKNIYQITALGRTRLLAMRDFLGKITTSLVNSTRS